ICFLGGRLALAVFFQATDRKPGHPAWVQARSWLEACLVDAPDHVEAGWCLAALRAAAGEQTELAAMAGALRRPDVASAPFQFLASVAQFATRNYVEAEAAARRAADLSPLSLAPENDAERAKVAPSLALESEFIVGLSRVQQGNSQGAGEAFRQVA